MDFKNKSYKVYTIFLVGCGKKIKVRRGSFN